jgi:hypothetical protein
VIDGALYGNASPLITGDTNSTISKGAYAGGCPCRALQSENRKPGVQDREVLSHRRWIVRAQKIKALSLAAQCDLIALAVNRILLADSGGYGFAAKI